jgi:pyruvate kinase
MDGADAVMLGETAAGTIRSGYSKMTQIIEAVENSPNSSYKNTPQIKQNVLSLNNLSSCSSYG